MASAHQQRGFQMIRPDNDWFPGLEELRNELVGNAWIFDKTPKFKVLLKPYLIVRSGPSKDSSGVIILRSFIAIYIFLFQVTKDFVLPDRLESGISSATPPKLQISFSVHSGLIRDVAVELPMGLSTDPDMDLASALQGLKFGPELPGT